MRSQTFTASVPRVVLDSNVWIDILVFDDIVSRPIRAALECGAIIGLTDSRCFDELTRVLDYPQFRAPFARFGLERDALLARTRELAQFVAPVESARAAKLPRCSDIDDQKFLELALAGTADWLVSKDRALLKLARRTARDFGFQIGTPGLFVEACGLDAEPTPTRTPDCAADTIA